MPLGLTFKKDLKSKYELIQLMVGKHCLYHDCFSRDLDFKFFSSASMLLAYYLGLLFKASASNATNLLLLFTSAFLCNMFYVVSDSPFIKNVDQKLGGALTVKVDTAEPNSMEGRVQSVVGYRRCLHGK